MQKLLKAENKQNCPSTERHIRRIFFHLVKNNPEIFFYKVFKTLHPNQKFHHNWHINLILEYLRSVEKGQIKRLIINIPPRSLKSICISVFWPAWLMSQDPSRKIITASYSSALSIKHAQDCRFIMQSDWFKNCFPNTHIIKGSNTKSKFCTYNHGFRFSTSIGGTLTGEGGDFIIVDDPQMPEQVFSTKEREKTIRWFEQTLSSRLNNKKQGAIVLVMQRLHQNDLAGHLIKKGGWTELKIPMIATKDELISFNKLRYQRRSGEILNAKMDSKEIINKTKNEIGSYGFESQYQQNPPNIKSQFIKSHWLKEYTEYEFNITKDTLIYQSWDCAVKTKSQSDYSVCATIGSQGSKYYLLDIMRKKLPYPQLKKQVIQMEKKFSPNAIIIEDRASGQQLIQDFQSLKDNTANINHLIIPFTSKYDKLTRLMLVMQIFESGSFYIPKKIFCNNDVSYSNKSQNNIHNKNSNYQLIKQDTQWVQDFQNEMLNFPHSEHDDQVDAVTQCLIYLLQQKRMKIEALNHNNNGLNPSLSVL